MSTNYSRTGTQIITRSLRIIGRLAQGETPAAQAVTDALEALNTILKNISMKGTVLTQTTNSQINLSTTTSEVIGTDGANYRCIKGHTSAATDQPVLTTSTATWSIYWQKGGSSGVTWNTSTAYTSKRMTSVNTDWDTINKAIWRKDGYDYDLKLVPYETYLGVVDKMETATIPSTMAIEYTATGMNVYIWPVPESMTACSLTVEAVKLFNDMASDSATPELPANWIDYLTYKLASNLADEYTLPLQERAYLSSKAEDLMKECLSSNTTFESPRYVRGAF